MINTLNIKQAQLKNGYFKIGNGLIRVLILGSCRVAPYISYFNEYNKVINTFTIFSIDPFNNHWNENDERVDYMEALEKLETDERLLEMLGSIDYFVHEWYANAGMFNCNKEAEKNIYQFGLEPALDICIPNWNDVFVLANDILKFDADLRKKAEQDINVTGKLSNQISDEIYVKGLYNIQKFYDICHKSDLPELAEDFERNFTNYRYFWTYNHVSNIFTQTVFNMMNTKFLKLVLTNEFCKTINDEDMFANNYTKLTQLDIDNYGFDWGEEVVPLFT